MNIELDAPPRRHTRIRGITNKQAKLLAELQRENGEPYTGSGMSAARASREITSLIELKHRQRQERNSALDRKMEDPRA